MSSMIVTDADLAELTGYNTPGKQKACLDKHGIFYIEGKDGRIRTTWGHIHSPGPRRTSSSDGFNLEALS